MFNIILKKEDGITVHTFDDTVPASISEADLLAVWEKYIVLVQGYVFSEIAGSAYEAENWRQRMAEEYKEDCIQAVTELTKLLGIIIN